MIALKASVRGVLVRLPTEPQRQVAVTDKQRVYTWNPGNGFSVLDRFRRFNHHDGRDTLVPLIQVCLDPFHKQRDTISSACAGVSTRGTR